MRSVSFVTPAASLVAGRSPRGVRQNASIMQLSKGCEPEVQPPNHSP